MLSKNGSKMEKSLLKYFLIIPACIAVVIACNPAEKVQTSKICSAVTCKDMTFPGNDTAGSKQLFSGKDLAGWTHVVPGHMAVENGMIRTHGEMGLLYWCGRKLGKCTLRTVFGMPDGNDGLGVFIRFHKLPEEEWMQVLKGYEVQIDNHPERSDADEYHSTLMLYSVNNPLAIAWKPGLPWNTMEITLDWSHTIVVLNGIKVTDFREGRVIQVQPKKNDFEHESGPRPEEGYFGLQNHCTKDIVFFKEVAIKPLAK
jgi:hypothetical protein